MSTKINLTPTPQYELTTLKYLSLYLEGVFLVRKAQTASEFYVIVVAAQGEPVAVMKATVFGDELEIVNHQKCERSGSMELEIITRLDFVAV